MRILWVATKPPWPPSDGGRLLMAETLAALAAAGHRITLVAAFDPSGLDRRTLEVNLRDVCEPHLVPAVPRGAPWALIQSWWAGLPLSIVRHASGPVRQEVARRLASTSFQVVHAEQLQAVSQCQPASERGVPVVMRAQNVEADLWAGLAATRNVWGPLARRESRRLAQYEGRAAGSLAATVALSARDAERLRSLSAGRATIHHVPPPFPSRLDPADQPLPGDPAVVLLGGGWLPNREGAAWFVRQTWPRIEAECPAAVLHVFGPTSRVGGSRSIVTHEAPADSRTLFAPGAILAVPLRIASGVRVKILEAWARGVPVVATPEAAGGLDAEDGRELLQARDAVQFARAIRRLHADPALAAATIEAGRSRLRACHEPRAVAGQLTELYARVAASART